MIFPRVCNDLLIADPSRSRCPDVPARSDRSLPARSIRLTLETLVCSSPSSMSTWVIIIVKTAWDRLLVAFMLVDAVARYLLPSAM